MNLSTLSSSALIPGAFLLSVLLATGARAETAHASRRREAVPPAKSPPISTHPTVKTGDTGDDDEADDDQDSDDKDDGDDDDSDFEVAANVRFTTDYVDHGLSQTGHQPAVQGGLDAELPWNFYIGMWGSSVHFEDSPASLELNHYLGFTHEFPEGWKGDVSLVRTTYWDDARRDSWSIPLKADWREYRFELVYTPDWQGDGAQSWAFQGGWEHKLQWEFKLGLYAGYTYFTHTGEHQDYPDLSATLSREWLGLDWTATAVIVPHKDLEGAQASSGVLFSVGKEF